MNLAMYNLPSNLKSSLHKTWQTLLLFLKLLQKQTLMRKMWGDMAYYNPTWKSGGHVTRVPHQIAPMQPIMTLVQITNYTSPNCMDLPQVNVHCIEHFFTVHEFWATCACPGKTELPWKFSLYCIYFSHSGFLTTCACPENRVCLEILHCIEYIFYHSGLLSNFVLALKNRGHTGIFTVWNILFTFRSYRAFCMRLPWKTEGALIFFTVLNMHFLSFSIF